MPSTLDFTLCLLRDSYYSHFIVLLHHHFFHKFQVTFIQEQLLCTSNLYYLCPTFFLCFIFYFYNDAWWNEAWHFFMKSFLSEFNCVWYIMYSYSVSCIVTLKISQIYVSQQNSSTLSWWRKMQMNPPAAVRAYCHQLFWEVLASYSSQVFKNFRIIATKPQR